MKKFVLILLFLLTLISGTFPQDSSFVNTHRIGETIVSVVEQCCQPCESGILYINLHSNEITSVKAAEQYLTETGGRLINIDNCGERLISFTHNSKDFTFDPNRIYSLAGINSTIRLFSHHYNIHAAKEVLKFANHLRKNYIDSSKLIIALHNNRDSSLSVITYKKEYAINEHLGKVFINPAMDSDDFMITTDTIFFNRIKEKNINVIWENVKAIKDDGSLSIYAARHNIPYINVEAQHEHSEEQLYMLKALDDIIKAYREEKEMEEQDSKL